MFCFSDESKTMTFKVTTTTSQTEGSIWTTEVRAVLDIFILMLCFTDYSQISSCDIYACFTQSGIYDDNNLNCGWMLLRPKTLPL